MEISDVRKRVLETLDRAKRSAAERRARADEAGREFDAFLNQIAVPLFRQVASALRPEGHTFTVFTPGGSVRLMSDRSQEDYIELSLETSGPVPQVIGHVSRARGRRVRESEVALADGKSIAALTEDDVLRFVLRELEPFVER
jgi:hypothetical protein